MRHPHTKKRQLRNRPMSKKSVVRIPNPVSNLDSIFTTFEALHSAYKGRSEFSLEESVTVGVDEHLMASKGHVGKMARSRSYNEDSSRDAMYNQFKMYAEVFRLLGWISSSSSSKRTSYRITYLGHLVAEAVEPVLLLEQCLLAMSFPNDANNVKFTNRVFPFCDLLLTMNALEGKGTRDEFIIGPMALSESHNEAEFGSMLDKLKRIRNRPNAKARSAALAKELDKLVGEITPNKNTVRNYTRIPLSALKVCWARELESQSVYAGNTTLLELSQHGRETAEWLLASKPFAPRCDEVTCLPLNQARAISIFGLIHLLKRAKFETGPLEKLAEPYKTHLSAIPGYTNGTEILFCAYQQLSPEKLTEILGKLIPDDLQEELENDLQIAEVKSTNKPQMPETTIRAVKQANHTASNRGAEVIRKLQKAISESHNVGDAIEKVFKEYRTANQNKFYPAVADLFTELGFKCQEGRAGVTGLRWDAFIRVPHNIPIEIKSPGEELFIQVKGIRQALENKVILTSRNIYEGAAADTTSLVVGYMPPRDRAEVAELIQDIKKVYGINVGVIDFLTLLGLVAKKLVDGATPSPDDLRTLVGVMNVS